jgi:hypothetical protein
MKGQLTSSALTSKTRIRGGAESCLPKQARMAYDDRCRGTLWVEALG